MVRGAGRPSHCPLHSSVSLFRFSGVKARSNPARHADDRARPPEASPHSLERQAVLAPVLENDAADRSATSHDADFSATRTGGLRNIIDRQRQQPAGCRNGIRVVASVQKLATRRPRHLGATSEVRRRHIRHYARSGATLDSRQLAGTDGDIAIRVQPPGRGGEEIRPGGRPYPAIANGASAAPRNTRDRQDG